MIASVSQSSAAVAKAKAANQSVTSSTVLVDEATLSSAIGASETWVFAWTLSATFSAVGQIQLAVVTPAGATLLAVATMVPNGILPAAATATTSGGAMSLVAALSTAGVVTVTATVVNGATAGTVKLQFAQASSDATATTIQAASSLVARRA